MGGWGTFISVTTTPAVLVTTSSKIRDLKIIVNSRLKLRSTIDANADEKKMTAGSNPEYVPRYLPQSTNLALASGYPSKNHCMDS